MEDSKTQTLEDVIGGSLEGLSQLSYVIVSMRVMDPHEIIMTGSGPNIYALSMEKLNEESISAFSESGDALFYMISTMVIIKGLEKLMKDGEKMPDGSYNIGGAKDSGSGNFKSTWIDESDESDEPELGNGGLVMVASMISGALAEGNKVASSPFLISKTRRARSKTPIQSGSTTEDLLEALKRSFVKFEGVCSPLYSAFAKSVADDEEAASNWFDTEGGRHGKNQRRGDKKSTRSDYGVDISGISNLPQPPQEFFQSIFEAARKKETSDKEE